MSDFYDASPAHMQVPPTPRPSEVTELQSKLAATLGERDAAIKRVSDLTIECGRHDILVERLKALADNLDTGCYAGMHEVADDIRRLLNVANKR